MRWTLLAMVAALGAACSSSDGNETAPDAADAPIGTNEAGGTAVLVLDRSALNVGTLDVAASGVGTVTVTNLGDAASGPLVVTQTENISVTGCTGALAAGASCTLTITIRATTADTFTGTVAVSANPGAVTPLVLSVVFSESGPLFWLSPLAIDLGNVPVGSATPPVTLVVTAGADLIDLAVTTVGSEVSLAETGTTCTAVLARGTSCVVTVNFLATTVGRKSDSVKIFAGGAIGKSATATITANVGGIGLLAVTPAARRSSRSGRQSPSWWSTPALRPPAPSTWS